METGSFKAIGGAAVDTYMMYNALLHTHKYAIDLHEDASKLSASVKTVSRNKLLSREYDVVILNSIRDVPLAEQYRSKHPNAKFIYIDRGNVLLNFQNAGIKRILPKMVIRYKYLLQLKRFLNHYVAITAEQAEFAGMFFDSSRTSFHHINIAPHKEFRSLGLNKRGIHAIAVGRLDERQKKLAFMLYGIKKVVTQHKELKKKILLKIIGTGPDENRYKMLVKSLGISENVVFEGFQRGEVLVNLYNTASFLVSTSEWESPGRSFLEAMACGLPVLLNTNNNAALSYSPMQSMVKDGHNGLVYIYGDLDDFAEKFYTLYSRKALARKLGENAHVFVKKFSFENTMKEYEKIIDSM